jgi:proteic killer suppression protein
MIVSFTDADAEKLFATGRSRRIPASLRGVTIRKLQLLDAATEPSSLLIPPGNQLEALRGDRRGQHSIRVNDQFRICFVWKNGNAHAVEFVDYH